MSCGISASFGLTKSAKQAQRENVARRLEAIRSLMYELDELDWRIHGFSYLTERQRLKLHDTREMIIEALHDLKVEVSYE